MGRVLDVDVVVTEHPSSAGECIRVKLAGGFELAHTVQAACQEMGGPKSVGMVVTEHLSAPSEGILAELTGSPVRADEDQDTEECIGDLEAVLVVGSQLSLPLVA
jgi:hypothetical protein